MSVTTLTKPQDPRTYGGWRKPRTPGLPRLGLIGTVIFFGATVFTMLVQSALGLRAALVCATVSAFVLAPLAYRNRAGRNGWQIMTASALWAVGRRKRQNIYLAGLAGPYAFGSHKLPGLLAPSSLIECADAYGQPFVLVRVPAARHYTLVLKAEPEGSQLVDQDTLDTWVAYHGQWLADLAHEPNLVAATVTVETSPDKGHRLATEVDRLLAPSAPELSRAVLREAADTYPRGGAHVAARIALTFNASRTVIEERELGGRKSKNQPQKTTRTRTPEEMALQVGNRLPGILRQLSLTGAGAVRPMTATEITESVRWAYDPGVTESIDALRAAGEDTGLTWETAGPVGAVEAWDSYRHDSAASITYQMVDAPRGSIQATVLSRLLEPAADVPRKRVTLIYRPLDPATAASIADRDVRTAVGRATARKGEARAGESAELAAARQAAREEAAGAGIEQFSLLVTATVDDPKTLPQAAETIDQLGRASRVLLRRCYGAQSASFAAGLGIGVILPSHVQVPDILREYL